MGVCKRRKGKRNEGVFVFLRQVNKNSKRIVRREKRRVAVRSDCDICDIGLVAPVMLPPHTSVASQDDIKNLAQKRVDTQLACGYDMVSSYSMISSSFMKLDESHFQVHLHLVRKKLSGQFLFAFICRTQLPSFEEIELFLRKNVKESDSEVSLVHFTAKFSKIFVLNVHQLEIIYDFNSTFLKDFLQEGTQTSFMQFREFNRRSNNAKLLFVVLEDQADLIADPKVNYSLMSLYCRQKLKEANHLLRLGDILRDINSSKVESGPHVQIVQQTGLDITEENRWDLSRSHFIEPELINYQSFDEVSRSTLASRMSHRLYRHHYIYQDYFRILCVIDPCITTIWQFLEALSMTLGMSIESIRKKLKFKDEVSEEQMKLDSIFTCVYEKADIYLADQAQMFHLLRKHFQLSQGWVADDSFTSKSPSIGNTDSLATTIVTVKKYSQLKVGLYSFNRRSPLVLCKKIPHLRSFEFLNEINICNSLATYTQSCFEKTFSCNKVTVALFPLEHFSESVLHGDQVDALLQGCAVLQSIKETMLTMQLAESLNLSNSQISIELLAESCSLASYSKQKNLELLEVVGDVVIKYLSSLFLFKRLPEESESSLTHIRSNFINNKFLGVTAFRNHLHLFMKSKKPGFIEWKDNFEVTDLAANVSTTKVNYSNLSDQLESVFGALFVSNNYNIHLCVGLARQLNLTFCQGYRNSPAVAYAQGSFLFIQLEDKKPIALDMTYRDLFRVTQDVSLIQKTNDYVSGGLLWDKIKVKALEEIQLTKKFKESLNKMESPKIYNDKRRVREQLKVCREEHDFILGEMLEEFEDHCIQYKFVDRQYLVTALTCQELFESPRLYKQDYQLLEFLGDSLIEILVVTNAYDLSRVRLGKIASPYFFCELKSLLLSNDFLSRMTVLCGFDRFAINLTSSQRQQIEQFKKECLLDSEQFRFPVSHVTISPKVLGDLWESIAGAVLMDSDITTFTNVFGKLYAPFIEHFVRFYKDIVFNEKEKVQLVAQLTNSQLECITEVDRDDLQINGFLWKKAIQLHHKVIGYATHGDEILAERQAFHDAYQRLHVHKNTNLGLQFLGRMI